MSASFVALTTCFARRRYASRISDQSSASMLLLSCLASSRQVRRFISVSGCWCYRSCGRRGGELGCCSWAPSWPCASATLCTPELRSNFESAHCAACLARPPSVRFVLFDQAVSAPLLVAAVLFRAGLQ